MDAAERFRDLRSRLGLTQEKAAAEVGVEPNTLARWERGEARVPAAAMRLLELLAERSGRASVSGGARGTTLDALHEGIRARLGARLDPGVFEACAVDLLRESWPTLVHVGGSGDSGLDGVTAGARGSRVQLIVTTAADVRRNLRKSLKAAAKRADHPGQAILATSRAITPKLRADLVDDANALGVRLLQVYSQEWFALELYRRPTWRKRLLGLTGRPSALGVVPRAPRRVYGDRVVGRTSELRQLRDAAQDAIVVGGPGLGKTFLLRVLAGEGRALFMNDDDRSAIADAVRESMPNMIIVDDAHLAEEGVASLMQLREEIGASFLILAATWPNYEKRVARVLDARTRIELPPMIADEVVDVVRAVGLQGPDWLIQSIVKQAEGRPGLAATLAHLCLAGYGRRVWSGEALADHLDPVLEKIAGGSALAVLAPFALGGSKGVSIEDAASLLDRSQSDVREALTNMAPAGVIRTDAMRGVAVTPESLRWIVVRDMFFGCGLMDASRLPWEATDTEERIKTLVGAVSRGAVVPSLDQLVEHVDRVEVWRHYAALGEEAAEHALAARPQLVREIASETLRSAPRRTINVLLDQAGANTTTDNRPEVVKFIDDLLEDFSPRIEPVIPIRRAVALAAVERLESARSPLTSAGVIACALRPRFESKRGQPGSGLTLTITFGVLPEPDLRELADIWTDVAAVLLQQSKLPWDELIRLLHDWRVVPGLTVGDEIRELMFEVARKMLSDLWTVGRAIPGVARRLADIGEMLGLGELIAEEPEELATLFPRARIRIKEEKYAQLMKRIKAMAGHWITRDDRANAAALALLEEQAAAGGLRYPRLTPVLGTELAAIHSKPAALAEALMEAGVSADVVEQILWKCEGRSGTDALRRAFGTAEYATVAAGIVLQMPEPPQELLGAALATAAQCAENVDTLCMLGHVPVATVARLLDAEDPHVARAAAIGIWNAEDKGVIPADLTQAWTEVVLQSADLGTEFRRHEEYWLGDILERDSALSLAWLRRLDLDQTEHGYLRHELREVAKKAIEALGAPDRLALIKAMRHDGPLASLSAHLVGTESGRYAALLARDELAGHARDPLRGHPTEEWVALALAALDRGREPADLASVALSGFHGWFGSASEMWGEWLTDFRALLDHSDPRIVEVARAGERILIPRIERCEEQERAEMIRGL